MKEECVSVESCPESLLPPFGSSFAFTFSLRGRSPFRTLSRVRSSPSLFLFLSRAPSLYFNVSLNRQQHPSGPSHPRLQPLGGNVYVSPASIILTQPPINRIQARRIAEYRWNTYGRQTGLGLGWAGLGWVMYLRNTAW